MKKLPKIYEEHVSNYDVELSELRRRYGIYT